MHLHKCETARLDGGVYHRIDENRQQAERLERTAMADPPPPLGAAAVTIETFIKSLVRRYRQDGSFPTQLQRIGSSLFHHVVNATSEEALQCPAVDQLLTACLQVLGQTFIQQHPSECGPLLDLLLRPPARVSCPTERLAEHFTPAAADPDTYVRLYGTVVRVGRDRAELSCLLLDRFGLESWLSSRRPSLSQRSALISALVSALTELGAHPERPDWSALHALYRRHLDTLHRHQFPEHYGEILQRLLDASRAGQLSPMCWFDFVNVLAAGVVTFTPQMDAVQRRRAVAALAERPGPLRPQEVSEGTIGP
ncbi:Ectopic P granules protein 5 [Amphibalanus amphitrite]|uniref:Ectopic P granules protein 5 n=1 Tax=Amphibalanus amphitrite TaxID=1232801 RepID=A0A6A4VCI9_AMPAM|nr:Ectopic P granules protein 5 [Amphibalanus amphitrite]